MIRGRSDRSRRPRFGGITTRGRISSIEILTVSSFAYSSGGCSDLEATVTITELRLDESTIDGLFRLAVFYSTGQFILLRITLVDTVPGYTVGEDYSSLTLSEAADPVIAARYESPLLVTVSSAFLLRFRHITPSKTFDQAVQVSLTQPAFRSSLCWRPLVLTLSKTGVDQYRASIAFSTPFYPSSWTVGLQQFDLRLPHTANNQTDELSIDTHSAICIPQSQAIRPIPLVTAIHHSDAFIVTSRSDNTIDVHEVIQPEGVNPLRVEYRTSLFGHNTSVQRISIQGDRCVSGGLDGLRRTRSLL